MRFLQVWKTRKGKPLNFKALERPIEAICKKFHLDLFYLFGSYASGKAGHLSDVDVAYLSSHKVDQLKLLPELQKLFAEEAIDLVDLQRAPITLTHQILKKGKCLYAKDLKTKIGFETSRECEYFDTASLREVYFHHMLKRIAHGTYGH